jgi:hypothetical protein
MAIGENATIEFFGTQDTVTLAGGTSAVTDTSFSASGDVVSGGWTNDDDARYAEMVLTFQYPSGTIDTGGIHLYGRKLNIDGTDDEGQPDSSHGHKYMGSFATDSGLAATTDISAAVEIVLDNNHTSQIWEFYVENQCGVTMTAGWTLKITPKAIGPHAA